VRALVFLLAVLSLAGCRVHTLQDGAYDFTLVETLRDDCGLASQPGVFTRGTLITAGHMVRLQYGYLGAEFTGTYRYGLEEMTMDATLANVRTTLRGQDCQVDSVAVALDSSTVNAGRFTGTLNFTFQTRTSDACTCRFYARYEATRGP
jgi:hypothetical protein